MNSYQRVLYTVNLTMKMIELCPPFIHMSAVSSQFHTRTDSIRVVVASAFGIEINVRRLNMIRCSGHEHALDALGKLVYVLCYTIARHEMNVTLPILHHCQVQLFLSGEA